MGKPLALMGRFLFIISILVMISSTCTKSSDQEMDPWLNQLSRGSAREKLSHLHFYFHDTFSGPNPTAVRVAQSTITDKSPTLFGGVVMIDDPLTEGPDSTSKEVGRAQGLYGSSGQKTVGLLMAMNFVFTTGKFNCSTLTILGRNPALEPQRELPIICGTGVFRLARGFAMLKTHFFQCYQWRRTLLLNIMLPLYITETFFYLLPF